MSLEEDLKVIDEVNEIIDNVIAYCDKALSGLSGLKTKGEKAVQKKVDTLCENMSNKVNKQLNAIRTKAINVLREKYLSANSVMNKFMTIATLKPTNLSTVIDVASGMSSQYTKPYEDALSYSTNFKLEAIMKLIDLTDNASQLANIKSNAQSLFSGMHINFDKLNIKFKPITIQELMFGATEDGETPVEKPKRQATFNSMSEFKKNADKYAQPFDIAYVYYKTPENGYIRNRYVYLPTGWSGYKWETADMVYTQFSPSDITRNNLILDVGYETGIPYLQKENGKNQHITSGLGNVDEYLFFNKEPLYLRLGDEQTFVQYNYDTKTLTSIKMQDADLPIKFVEVEIKPPTDT